MDEEDSISSILSEPRGAGGGAASVTPVPQPGPAGEPQPGISQPSDPKDAARDAQGRFASAVKAEAAPAKEGAAEPAGAPPAQAAQDPAKQAAAEPAKDGKDLPRADVAAIIDERRRRQAAERELEQLRANQPAAPKTDFWADPEKATQERLQASLAPLQDQLFNLTLENAKLKFPDFDNVVTTFLEVAQKDPVLAYQADHAPDPIAFIYREGKRLKELAPYGGDFSKYAEGVTGQLKGELGKRDEQIKALTAEIEALKKANSNLESIPRSLNKASESAPRSAAEVDEDSISSIVRLKSA